MPLTTEFKNTVQARARIDQSFRVALMKEGIECLLAGDVDTGKIILRDYINATIGFDQLASLTDKPPKSLMRMFGPSGNPHARNLFEALAHIQRHEGVQLAVTAVQRAQETDPSAKPVESVCAILGSSESGDDYIEEIRGR
ncbi:MAG: hypothetical protein OXB92_11670 [Acidimicrobiaceae bacterium]|nr:hypothetical protein [Acidimicrobiaceae bacterium]